MKVCLGNLCIGLIIHLLMHSTEHREEQSYIFNQPVTCNIANCSTAEKNEDVPYIDILLFSGGIRNHINILLSDVVSCSAFLIGYYYLCDTCFSSSMYTFLTNFLTNLALNQRSIDRIILGLLSEIILILPGHQASRRGSSSFSMCSWTVNVNGKVKTNGTTRGLCGRAVR